MKRFLYIITWCLTVLFTLVILFYSYAFFDRLSLDEQRSSITVYDSSGEILYESNFKRNMSWTLIDEIPAFIQQAFVAVEDKRFYQHPGFDPIRIAKATFTNLMHGDIRQGGSTITQQYAKNLFLTNEQTFARKFEELCYAARLEMQYSKKEILEGYLNTIYFGHGVYGIARAAQFFFDKRLEELSVAQIAMLVGIPNGPSMYSPFLNVENARKRQQLILAVFRDSDLISEEEKQQAAKETLKLAKREGSGEEELRQYYIDALIQELQETDIDLDQKLAVYTYYDQKAQHALSDAIKSHISKDSELETAGIVTQPFTGGIMAIAGGKDYTISQFNRAVRSKRQVASTIKPLLYYCALKQGFTPATQFLSQKTTFRLSKDELYSPSNYGEQYANQNISMINAISLSDNIYAVKTHLFLGEDTLHNALLDFGIDQSQPNASEALGTVNMSLLELSRIYNTFASEGLYVKPSMIRMITSGEDVVYENKTKPERKLQRDETLMLSQMLTATFDIRNKGHTFPSMYGYEPAVTMAAKSGTSNWDSLVMAYNPEYVVGIWCGFDDNRTLDKKYYTLSKQIFKDTVNALYKGKSAPWYQPSDGLSEKKVDPISGKSSSYGSVYWFRKNE